MWRRRACARIAVAGSLFVIALLAAAGCSGSHSVRSAETSVTPPATPSRHASTGAVSRCTAAVATAATLGAVRTSMLGLPGAPFGVATVSDGAWSFVALPSGIGVVSDSAPAPRLVRTIALPAGLQPYGETLTPDGRHLLIAAGTGAVVIDTATAERGTSSPVLGVLSSTHDAQQAGAVEVSVSPDGAYAFVSLEYRNALAVFDLRAATASHFTRPGFVGLIPLGQGVVGTALSPDGRWLYATSEFAAGQNPQASQTQGTLAVIDARRAESEPAHAVLTTVAAGCQPVRVATAAGAIVWVTARGSNALLGFSAADLHDASAQHALRANVHVGEEPVGLALVDNEHRLIVADSDRFQAPGAQPALTVVDPNAALAGKPALLGSIPTGAFPREMAAAPGRRTLQVADYGSNQLQTIDLTTLP